MIARKIEGKKIRDEIKRRRQQATYHLGKNLTTWMVVLLANPRAMDRYPPWGYWKPTRWVPSWSGAWHWCMSTVPWSFRRQTMDTEARSVRRSPPWHMCMYYGKLGGSCFLLTFDQIVGGLEVNQMRRRSVWAGCILYRYHRQQDNVKYRWRSNIYVT